MADAAEVRREIERAFREAYGKSRSVGRVLAAVRDGLAEYAGITDYSEEVGRIMSRAMLGEIEPDCLSDGVLDASVAHGAISPSIGLAYSEVASVAAGVQRNINSAAGIGFNGITGKIDRSRVGNLLAKLAGNEFEKTKWLLGEAAMASVTRSAVTDTIRENAKFHKEAGIHPYLRRYSRGKCCDWCDSMQGAWEYGEQPDDFWRIHEHCTCVIEYKPSKYKRADIIRYVTGEDGKMRKVTEQMGQDGKSSSIPDDMKGNFDDFEPLSLTRNERRALLRLRELSDRDNCEYGVLIRDGGAGEPFTSDDGERVRIDLSRIAAGTSIFHSHTNDTPFSTQDFSFLLDERVEKIGVIAYNKDTFIVSVGDGWRQAEKSFILSRTTWRNLLMRICTKCQIFGTGQKNREIICEFGKRHTE